MSYWITVYQQGGAAVLGYAVHPAYWQSRQDVEAAHTRKWAYKGYYCELEER
jgi:hypothetical protein